MATIVAFNTYFDGRIRRIALTPEKSAFTLRYSRPDEEGYSFESRTFTLEDGYVRFHSASGGCDCDGPISYYDEGRCAVERLAAGAEHEGIRFPAWEHGESSVYDAYAVSAGY